MMKSKFTLFVLFITLIISTPAFTKDNEKIEAELEKLNLSQEITNEILEEIKEQLANNGACPCFSLTQLNQLLGDYGPFLPNAGGEVVRDICEAGTAIQSQQFTITRDDILANKRDLCETPALGPRINRAVTARVNDPMTTARWECHLAALDATDNTPEAINATLEITESEYQVCRSIALQWARQNGIQ